MTPELKTRVDKRRWRKAYEFGLDVVSAGGVVTPARVAAAYADSVIIEYRIRGLKP